ncbi:MAG: dockerin type I repeat-containing protein [Coprobacillus cateniformis]
MYTFKYKDVNGEEKELIAKVTWIDKIIPTATVEYDVTGETQFQVKATLKNISKKNVTIIDGSDGTYTFTKNGEYTFKIRDNAGNIGEIVAKVTRIEEKQEIEEIIKGDINGDGVFDIVELTILNKHLIETQRIIDSKWLIAADLNKDGKIDIVDLSILNKKINK